MHAPLIYNQWFGKALGFTGAFVVAPNDHSILAACVILGVAVGHLFDIWAARTDQPKTRFSVPGFTKSQLKRSQSEVPFYLDFLFAAMGAIAKNSGLVTEQHIRYTERLVTHLGLNTNQRQHAIAQFYAGRDGKFAFQPHAREILDNVHAPEVSRMVLMALVDTTAIAPTDPALASCVNIAQHLNIPGSTVAREFSVAMTAARKPAPTKAGAANETKHKNNQQGRQTTASDTVLADAYAALNLNFGADAAATKKAYRRLVNRHHPDKLPRNATPRELERAQAEMVALREALETIEAFQEAN